MVAYHYINVDLHQAIVNQIKLKLKNNPDYANPFLGDFKKKTEQLKNFSLNLQSIENFENLDFIRLFENFCSIREDFGPNLYIFLFIIEGCENVILDDFKDKSETTNKLIKQVSSKVQSEFFGTKNNDNSDHIENYFPPKYDPYIKLLTEMMEYRDRRKVVYDDSWYKYSSGFFKELETRSKLGNKIYFFIFGDKEDVIINYGKDVAKLKDEILKSTINSYDKVSGSVASRGTAIGKVRLIEPHVKNQKFEEGEILVTRMTTPDLMPLIKKASAIITDEGGITCHAAIVSREFKKPCIIGTKIATQIFKDGDIVEVDAEAGVINRVK